MKVWLRFRLGLKLRLVSNLKGKGKGKRGRRRLSSLVTCVELGSWSGFLELPDWTWFAERRALGVMELDRIAVIVRGGTRIHVSTMRYYGGEDRGEKGSRIRGVGKVGQVVGMTKRR